jgi:hypothetical protein
MSMLAMPAVSRAGAAEVFEQLKSLAGDWEAPLPGFGKLTSSVRLVSNGKAIEETIGTPADNELSIYTASEGRIVATHYCAMTADGHQVRLQTPRLASSPDQPDHLDFVFAGASNLHSMNAPHMRRLTVTMTDPNHYSEKWIKTENGKDTVFDLNFVRRQAGRAIGSADGGAAPAR